MYGILFSIVVQGKQAVKADGTPVSNIYLYICYWWVDIVLLVYSITQIGTRKANLTIYFYDLTRFSAKKRGMFCNMWTRSIYDAQMYMYIVSIQFIKLLSQLE